MAAYNAANTIRESIDSTLQQTFHDFELIIINDGSTDNTEAIIQSYSDVRIKYLANEKNIGLPCCLNRAISVAHGTYIARMDADDIMHPKRLSIQYAYMEAHPDIDIVGSDYRMFDETSHTKRRYMPRSYDMIKSEMLYNSPFCHPAAMLRKRLFNDFQYDESFRYCQDYELWTRLLPYVRGANIPKVLLYYRINHDGNTMRSLSHGCEKKLIINKIQHRLLVGIIGLSEDKYDNELQWSLGLSDNIAQIDIIRYSPDIVKKYLDEIHKQVTVKKYCSNYSHGLMIGKIWLKYLLLNRQRLAMSAKIKMIFHINFLRGIYYLLQRSLMHR